MMRFEDEFRHVFPEAVGIPSRAVSDFIDNIRDKSVNLHSFILMRHGKTAAEGYYKPYSPDLKHNVYSVTKSFVSAAVGIAVSEGLLSPEDRVIGFFPEKTGENIHEYTAMITVRDLLTMASVTNGQTVVHGPDWLSEYMAARPGHPPSTIFAYDNMSTYLLCAILQKLTGMTVHEYMKKRVLEPVGMGEIEWSKCPMGINIGGYGIRCTPRDMARFGQLYIQGGIWNGRRVIPEDWVKISTSRQIDCSNAEFILDGKAGYGYQFWRCRNNSYCAFGTGGQYILVIPDKDIVFVTTANTRFHKNGHQLILDSFWEVLYPQIAQDTLPENRHEFQRLEEKLESLALFLPEDAGVPEISRKISRRRIVFDSPYEGYTGFNAEFTAESPSLVLYKGEQRHVVDFGYNSWVTGCDPFLGHEAACGGVWVDDKRFVLHIQLLDALQMFMLTFGFTENTVSLQIQAGGALPEADRLAGILPAKLPQG